jgi:hypothetical protein
MIRNGESSIFLMPVAGHYYQSGAGGTGAPFLECNFIHVHAALGVLKVPTFFLSLDLDLRKSGTFGAFR